MFFLKECFQIATIPNMMWAICRSVHHTVHIIFGIQPVGPYRLVHMYQQPELVHTGRKSIQSLSKFIIKHTVAQSSSTCIEEPGGRKTMQHAAKSSKQHVQASLTEIHNLGSGLLLPSLFTSCTQVFCFLVDLCCYSFGLSILLVHQSELLQTRHLLIVPL